MRFAQPRRARGGVINMTSLIDMMFLLVIFVLVAARFEPEAGVKLTLPQGASPLTTPKKSMTLLVAKDRRILFGQDEITPAEFPARLAAARAAIQAEDGPAANPTLVIWGDKDVDYGFMTELVDAAQRAGQTAVSLKTRP